MNKNILMIFFTSIIVSISPLLEKILLKKISPEFLLIYDACAYLALFLPFLVIRYSQKNRLNKLIGSWKDLRLNEKFYIFILSFIGLIGGICVLFVLKKNEMSYVVPFIGGLRNIIIFFFGYYFLKEKITINNMIGVILISVGIYLINDGN